jgi:hypothetical protein
MEAINSSQEDLKKLNEEKKRGMEAVKNFETDVQMELNKRDEEIGKLKTTLDDVNIDLKLLSDELDKKELVIKELREFPQTALVGMNEMSKKFSDAITMLDDNHKALTMSLQDLGKNMQDNDKLILLEKLKKTALKPVSFDVSALIKRDGKLEKENILKLEMSKDKLEKIIEDTQNEIQGSTDAVLNASRHKIMQNVKNVAEQIKSKLDEQRLTTTHGRHKVLTADDKLNILKSIKI